MKIVFSGNLVRGETHGFYFLQNRILVIHESPLICPLLKITPKASSKDASPEEVVVHEDTESGGFALGEFIAR